VSINKPTEKSQHIMLRETDLIEVFNFIKSLLSEIPDTLEGVRTSITMREYLGKESGKSVTTSLRGADVNQVYNLITNKLQHESKTN
jgi:hypothetical protein